MHANDAGRIEARSNWPRSSSARVHRLDGGPMNSDFTPLRRKSTCTISTRRFCTSSASTTCVSPTASRAATSVSPTSTANWSKTSWPSTDSHRRGAEAQRREIFAMVCGNRRDSVPKAHGANESAGLGVRQSSAALGGGGMRGRVGVCSTPGSRFESARGLAHSKTLSRDSGRRCVQRAGPSRSDGFPSCFPVFQIHPSLRLNSDQGTESPRRCLRQNSTVLKNW